jgi:hypothetical protein
MTDRAARWERLGGVGALAFAIIVGSWWWRPPSSWEVFLMFLGWLGMTLVFEGVDRYRALKTPKPPLEASARRDQGDL